MFALLHKHLEGNIIHYIILNLPFIKTRVFSVRDPANVPFWEHINISIMHGHIEVKLINMLNPFSAKGSEKFKFSELS